MIMVDIFAHYLRFTYWGVFTFENVTEVWISDEQFPLKGCISSPKFLSNHFIFEQIWIPTYHLSDPPPPP